MFLKITNESPKEKAIFNLMPFLEKNLDKDPYSEVAQIDDGKVIFESDKNQVAFQAL